MKKRRITPFADAAVADAFAAFSEKTRAKLLEVRELIFEIAAADKTIGSITETLKWGEPAYLTEETGSGTTVRLNRVKGSNDTFGIYVHCQTSIVETFRKGSGKGLRFEKNRALLLPVREKLPKAVLKEYLHSALTYHSRR